MLWQNVSWTDVIDSLRAQTVPSGYPYPHWFVTESFDVHAFLCACVNCDRTGGDRS